MGNDPTISNLESKRVKLRKRPVSRTALARSPQTSQLASGITKTVIEAFKRAKKQRREQAHGD